MAPTNWNTGGWREIRGGWTVALGSRAARVEVAGVRAGRHDIQPGVVVQTVVEPQGAGEWLIECQTPEQVRDAMIRADRFVAGGMS